MNSPQDNLDGREFPYRPRLDHEPSPRLAIVVSLVVHTVLVLLLYRACSELANAPPLAIMATDSQPRWVATPTVHVVPSQVEIEPVEETVRPVVEVWSLSRRTAMPAVPFPGETLPSVFSIARTDMAVGPSRVTAPATLPAPSMELPEPPAGAPELPTAEATLLPSITPLARTDASPSIDDQLSPRLALREMFGPQPRRDVGRPLAVVDSNETKAARVRRPTKAFSHRHRNDLLPSESVAAIDRGLEFLARVQRNDGHWQFDHPRAPIAPNLGPASLRAEAAATGLALLAFLGAGHDHFDGRYRHVVDDGLQFLVRIQGQHGEFFHDDALPAGKITQFYSHGIATLALTEAFGMTGDEALRAPAQRALDHLASTQVSVGGDAQSLEDAGSDPSAIGWQLAALRSGQLAGLDVSPATLARLGEQHAVSAARPQAAREPQSGTVETAVGLAVELHLGGSRADERLRPAAELLLAHPPEVGDAAAAIQSGLPVDPRRDTYYWYYGSQAMSYLGGDDWRAWSKQLFPRLIETQEGGNGPLAGSWRPIDPANGVTIDERGRLYMTAMNLLSLETEQRQLRTE